MKKSMDYIYIIKNLNNMKQNIIAYSNYEDAKLKAKELDNIDFYQGKSSLLQVKHVVKVVLLIQ